MKLSQLKQLIREAIIAEVGENMSQLIKDMPYDITHEDMFKAAYFGKNALRFRTKTYNDINDGEKVLEMHIDIQPEDQGKGLAEKMIKVFLYKEGGVAYFSHGRIINNAVYKVLDKIKQDPKWLVQDEGNGITVQEK